MRTTTTTALAVGATALAVPAAPALAAGPIPPSIPGPALNGHAGLRAEKRAGRHDRSQHRLTTAAARLAERVAHARGRRFSRRAYRRRVHDESPARLDARIQHLRARLDSASTPPVLQAIATCESGGNPRTDTGNGFYGKYQFTESTWASVGGRGNPADASEAEQDRRAALLYAREGATPWPVCGR
jgi:hypothetical protein